MNYDLSKLSAYQADLDQAICLNHNINSCDTVERRILAFLVELGELANETRCFKYWSLKDASSKEIILEEYVDGIHFLISLGNELNCNFIYELNFKEEDLTAQFINIFEMAGRLKNNFNEKSLDELFKTYLFLGYSLGFNNDDIIDGYLLKNELNHKRQEEAY